MVDGQLVPSKLIEYGVIKRFYTTCYFGRHRPDRGLFDGFHYENATWVLGVCREVEGGIMYDMLDMSKMDGKYTSAQFLPPRMAANWEEVEDAFTALVVQLRMNGMHVPETV